MDPLSAVILGIVEGLTEFLPVSSTGHLILASRLLGLPDSEFLKSFEIAIQLGAICAVAVMYGKTLLTDRAALKRIAIAFVPTGVLGLVFHSFVKEHLLGNEAVVLWALVLGGVALIAFEKFHAASRANARSKPAVGVGKMTYRQAFVIGVAQSLAMVPGVSRSAATIVAGLAQGIDRKTVVEFSFLLAVPTMLAATGLDLAKSGASFTASQYAQLAVGFIVSAIVAAITVRFLLAYVRTRTFVPFGVYRIAVAATYALVVL